MAETLISSDGWGELEVRLCLRDVDDESETLPEEIFFSLSDLTMLSGGMVFGRGLAKRGYCVPRNFRMPFGLDDIVDVDGELW